MTSFNSEEYDSPSRVTGPFRGVIVRCSRGKGGPGDFLPSFGRVDRGGLGPGVGEIELNQII